MYAKIFSQIYDGTLCTKGPWEALVTFQQLLVLADIDGNVDMTSGAIARRTTIPIEIIEKGIEVLLLPDADSRTPTEEGRRIVLLCPDRSWGWSIVNYKHYRSLKREEDRREYHREYWHKRKLNNSTPTQHTQPSQPIEEAKEEASKRLHPADVVVEDDSYRVPNCPFDEILALYHEKLPMLPKVRVMSNIRMLHTRARWKQVCAEEKFSREQGLDWFAWYFGKVAVSKFLTGKTAGHDGRVWCADFEWLMNGSSFAKVIEGRYSQ